MSTWVPEKDRDTKYHIFRHLFKCRVSNIQTKSSDYIRHYGMPTSGDSTIDKQMANELVMRMMSIAQMVEYFSKGVNVYVCDPKDCEQIYKHITNHLIAWRDYMNNTLTPNKVPLKDLVLLDEFAAAVYPHASKFFTEAESSSILEREMLSIDPINKSNILSPLKPKVTVINGAGIDNEPEEKEDETPAYPSMGETFKRRLEERAIREAGLRTFNTD